MPTLATTTRTGTGSDRAALLRDVVAGVSGSRTTPDGGVILAREHDKALRSFGIGLYDLMLADPAVTAALTLLVAGVIAEGAKFAPAEKALPGEPVSDPVRQARLDLAAEIADSCNRVVQAMEPAFDDAVFDLAMQGYGYGCAAGEQIYDVTRAGPDAGRLTPVSLCIKPRAYWRFRVDPANRVRDLWAVTLDGMERAVPRPKWVVFTWRPVNGDPRGTSQLRPAYNSWNYKLQAFRDLGQYMKLCADPSLVLTAAQGMATAIVDGTALTPPQQMVHFGKEYKNHSVLGLPYGATATLIQASGNGEAYHKAFERYDMEILRSVLSSSRPIQEASHSSKADADASITLIDQVIRLARGPLARSIEDDFLYPYVLYNWGPDVARELTPKCEFAMPVRLVPELLTSLVAAWEKKFMHPAHRPFLWESLGWPQPPEDAEDFPDEDEQVDEPAADEEDDGGED